MAATIGSRRFSEDMAWSSSFRKAISQQIMDYGNAFTSTRSSHTDRESAAVDDEEALKWAAIEKLPTYNRLRTGILKLQRDPAENDHHSGLIALSTTAVDNVVDVAKLSPAERSHILDNILRVADEDNERFLSKLRQRIDRVAIELPKIEIRFQNLNVEAKAYAGKRALPTLLNFTLNVIEGLLDQVHLKRTEKRKLTILNDLNGTLKPSRMTLLLGPPASGKTTFLLALAGKLASELKVTGSVTYNGHTFEEFCPQGTAAYISQDDRQIGEMTVRETLDFSARCQGVGTRYDMLVELSRREKEAGIKPDPDIDIFMKAVVMEGQETSIVTDYVLKILGLDICADTLVGNDMVRGISGGQKKRLTTGEMLVGPVGAFFMDEISTGLDSSTTFQIIKCLRQFVHYLEETMVVSLLQPPPETFDLFDDVILLSEGQIVYQGPRDSIMEFFETMGFKCPERKSIPDFLQEVTSQKDQQQYWSRKNEVYSFIPAKDFSEAFASFHVGQRIQQDLSVPFNKSRSHPAALTTEKYGLGKWKMFEACLWRELLLMRRNSFLYIFKTVQISIMSLITMTVFFRTELHPDNVEDGELYLGALFFSLVNVMFNGFAELSMAVGRLPVYYKQRDQMFYPAWAASIPTFLTRIPLSLLEAGIWVAVTYYVIGFAPEGTRFFRQLLLFILISQMAYALFRFLGAAGRTMTIANTFGAFALLVIFVLGGFVISKDNIHKWWIWGYWISPMMYGQNALAVNEFLAPRWTLPYVNVTYAPTVGKAILKERAIPHDASWYWIGVGALMGFIVLFNVFYTMALAYLNPLGRPQAVISEEELDKKPVHQKNQASTMQNPKLGRQSVSRVEGVEIQERQPKRFSALGSGISEEQAMESSRKGMILAFEPLALSFDSISYFVDMPAEMKQKGFTENRLQLLQEVTGAFRPGVLTALVGISGAGKTTLMDVLAGRKTGGYIEGSISISGYPKNQATFSRVAGYCEQTDIHSPNITVEESIIYSSWLRLPKEVDKPTRMMFVEEVMQLVELDTIKNAIVGLPGVNGLSTEQRKRLTVGVELVANPSIIFMDEPTSGLDARAAAIVMRTVRNTVDTGRTVVCTIHQPSIDIFEAFDELLLMKRGGQVIYGGPLGHNSQHVIEYFEAIPNAPKIKEGYNPATWMLEITSPGAEAFIGVDFAELYRSSSLFKRNQALIKQLSVPAPGSKDLHFPTKYSQSFAVQCTACLWKQHWSYWRNPDYNAVRFFYTFVIAIMVGSVFWDLGCKRTNQQDINNIMGAMYAATLFLGINNANTIQPVVDIERTTYYREKAAGMYSALSYAIAQVVIEIPYNFVQTILYGVVVYFMISFEATLVKFLWFLFILFTSFMYFTLYGMMMVALTPTVLFGAILSGFLFNIWNLFSGFMIPRPRIPIWWRWFYWANPVGWTLYGLIASQLGDLDDVSIDVSGRGQMSVPQYLREYLGFRHDFLGAVAGAHVGMIFLFGAVFAICIKALNFQKR